MLKLYKDQLVVDIVVAAKNKKEARKLMEKHAIQECDNVIAITLFAPICLKRATEIPPGWENCIPWDDDENMGICNDTCAKRLGRPD